MTPRSETRALILIFILAFFLRILTAFIIHCTLNDDTFAKIVPPDAACDKVALIILASWNQGHEAKKGTNHAYNCYVAWIYKHLGYTRITAQALNALFGALAIFFLYDMARHLLNRDAARISILLYALFPSLIFWSSLNMREAPVHLLVTAGIWIAFKLREKFRMLHLAILLLIPPLFWSVNRFRYYLYIILAYSMISFFLVNLRRENYRKNLIYIIYIFILMCVLPKSADVAYKVGILSHIPQSVSAFFTGRPGPELNVSRDFMELNEKHRGLATGNTAIDPDADISTPIKAVKYLPKGIISFLFMPFPWRAESLSQKATIPENILLYLLIPFVLYGMYCCRKRWRLFTAINFFTLVTLLGYSLITGNYGTAYRHKAVLLPFIFLYAGAGISHLLKKRAWSKG